MEKKEKLLLFKPFAQKTETEESATHQGHGGRFRCSGPNWFRVVIDNLNRVRRIRRDRGGQIRRSARRGDRTVSEIADVEITSCVVIAGIATRDHAGIVVVLAGSGGMRGRGKRTTRMAFSGEKTDRLTGSNRLAKGAAADAVETIGSHSIWY